MKTRTKKKFQCSYNDLDGNQLFMYSCRSSITLIGAILCNLNSLLCTMSWMGRHYESDYTKSKTIETLWCKILHACLYENAKQPTRLHDFLSFFLFFFSFSKPLSLNFSSNINNVLFFPFYWTIFCVFCLYSSYLSVFLWRAFIILYPIIFFVWLMTFS